jgi:hypothetical protein
MRDLAACAQLTVAARRALNRRVMRRLVVPPFALLRMNKRSPAATSGRHPDASWRPTDLAAPRASHFYAGPLQGALGPTGDVSVAGEVVEYANSSVQQSSKCSWRTRLGIDCELSVATCEFSDSGRPVVYRRFLERAIDGFNTCVHGSAAGSVALCYRQLGRSLGDTGS